MQVEAFDFDLPDENIALRPANPRDAARLLHVSKSGRFSDHIIRDLPSFFSAGDLIVVNNTKVIPARMEAERQRPGATGSRIELTLTDQVKATHWRALMKPAKRVKPSDKLVFKTITADVISRQDGMGEIVFNVSPEQMEQALVENGAMPLPPYIAAKRKPDDQDLDDYQTMFAERDGAVAAPTAGLHFTPAIMKALQAKGVNIAAVTLHVGPGTFLPVKVDDISNHKMHSEWGEVSQATADQINTTLSQGGKVTCVGTTSLRLIESAATSQGHIQAFSGDTDIFIAPGYQFKIADRLMTNFHLPKSTLFMLVSAFSGLETMKKAYAHAVASGYRFYSYGDGCLLELQDT
ncbi:MAG: tRNA preQ1(34) S-adenosylmethionine ribosyltransferase-isomerase QueA [Parvibaculales bacterium]